MEFSEETIQKAWIRANGRCECERISHSNHKGSYCGKVLSFENRGRDTGRGAWEAHHKGSKDDNSLSNCEILCWDCHKQTF